MSEPVYFHQHRLQLLLTPKAATALAKRVDPLFIRMELLFSCLVKKSLLFHNEAPQDLDVQEIGPGLFVGFQAMMNRSCQIGEETHLIEFQAKRYEQVQPKWLQLDYALGRFCGDFGFRLQEAPSNSPTASLQRLLTG